MYLLVCSGRLSHSRVQHVDCSSSSSSSSTQLSSSLTAIPSWAADSVATTALVEARNYLKQTNWIGNHTGWTVQLSRVCFLAVLFCWFFSCRQSLCPFESQKKIKNYRMKWNEQICFGGQGWHCGRQLAGHINVGETLSIFTELLSRILFLLWLWTNCLKPR